MKLPGILSASKRADERLRVNPTLPSTRPEASSLKITVYEFHPDGARCYEVGSVDSLAVNEGGSVRWINIDGLRKTDVELVCEKFGVHRLLAEDILSSGQRPKMDEVDGVLFALLNMLYFSEPEGSVCPEQISIVLKKNLVISFQEEAEHDVFDNLRKRIESGNGRIRQKTAVYIFYMLLDTIVDHYFIVLDQLGMSIESLEESIVHENASSNLERLNALRKEMIVMRRNVTPVRDLVGGILRSESPLLDEKALHYFKDIQDHIMQAADQVENYGYMMTGLQDLYLNEVNIKMNESMKVMAIVTCLLAPATVIGGIFGMNFESIPYLHNRFGFYAAVGLMLLIPVWMIRVFRKRGWF